MKLLKIRVGISEHGLQGRDLMMPADFGEAVL
jgi:hypothetical protein